MLACNVRLLAATWGNAPGVSQTCALPQCSGASHPPRSSAATKQRMKDIRFITSELRSHFKAASAHGHAATSSEDSTVAGQLNCVLPPRIQHKDRKQWVRYYHKQWMAGAPAPVYRVNIPISGRRKPKRHTAQFDTEHAASEYVADYCKNRRRFKVRSLAKAYQDPAYKHLQGLMTVSRTEEVHSKQAVPMPQEQAGTKLADPEKWSSSSPQPSASVNGAVTNGSGHMLAGQKQVETSSSDDDALLIEIAGSCAEAAEAYDAARYSLQVKVKSLVALCKARYGSDGDKAALDMLRQQCPKQAWEVFGMAFLEIE